MSGIVGIVNLDGAPADPALLEQMVGRLAFRGPDAQNTWLDGPVGLGHALLRTTLEAPHEQGPCSLDGQTWITADARVDGRADLLRELHAQGRAPADEAPDPELILHAYHAWGEACLEHLSGDFSFVIWDGPRQRLFCARDQFGVVPFYYAQVGHSLVCSNTLDAVLLHPAVSDALNERAIGDYLLFRSNHDLNTTFFADVRRLPPAHALTWSAGDDAPRLRRYWALPERDDYLRYPRSDDYVERFRELFRQAVTDRLRTDRVSVAMSGGMDSPAVAAVAHQVLSAPGQPFDLQAFTFTHTLIPHEEGHYAGLVAEALGFPVHFLEQDARLLGEPPRLPGALSPEPNFVFTWWLNPWGGLWARAAATGRVLLTGHGGDPALRSSPTYWLDLLKRGQIGQVVMDMRQYVRAYGRRPPFYLRRGRSRPARTLPAWLDPDFAARLDLPARLQEQAAAWGGHDGLSSMAANPFWSNFLASFDPGNTRLPFKARFPFFDLRLVSYLTSVPPVPWFEGKRLLREATRDLLPEVVRGRRKTLRAGLPLEALTQEQGAPAYLIDLVAAPELAPYVDRDALLRTVRAPGTAEQQFKSILRPVTLAYWLRHRPHFHTSAE